MRYLPIVPAVIPKSSDEVIQTARSLKFSAEYHLDLVDGNFVSSVCWPYEPKGEPISVKPKLDFYTLEIDLMVSDPIEAANTWIKAGADMLVFHIETISLSDFKKFTESCEVSVGVSAHGETTLVALSEYAKEADYIQLMGIREIGAQGLPFDEEVIDKIKELKQKFPFKSITVDGSVNKNTIKLLADAGADRLVCGSAIVKQPDPEQAYKELNQIINQ